VSEDEKDTQRQMEVVKAAAARLREHFDSVQIFCTVAAPDNSTRCISWGEGDWFARYGHVREWVTKTEARARKEAVEEEGEET